MRPLREIRPEQCAALTHLFCDIDDTITKDGLLPRASYDALWRLVEHGIAVVPVTGRPAGWCDMIARFWPVAGVVGENGAFYFRYERDAKRMERVFLMDAAEREAASRRMERARDRILSDVPGSALAADQDFRIADIAIDYCEDVPPLGSGEVERICAILEEEGLHYKVSSIHVNFWYGEHDKVRCVERFVADRIGRSVEEIGERLLFVGDSPNDEPLFARLPLSIGVANVSRYADSMRSLPGFVTDGESADGFQEAVSLLLSRRATESDTTS